MSNADIVMYMGRQVLTAGFRAYVYGLEDKKLLVNSYNEFEKAISSGLWYASKKEVPVTEPFSEKTYAKKKGDKEWQSL